uniref:Uncharacterized protein n=1 Tax=Rhizophora mucronata TaxID=61149 RepID=A0A2P2PZP4_RHIMU
MFYRLVERKMKMLSICGLFDISEQKAKTLLPNLKENREFFNWEDEQIRFQG